MGVIYCEKVEGKEEQEICARWFRDEGICRDCPSYISCKLYVEQEKDNG